MAAFWIYENWTHDRVRVHRADCSFCNNGEGTQHSTSDRNGHWLPFTSYEEAWAAAQTMGRADTAVCAACTDHRASGS